MAERPWQRDVDRGRETVAGGGGLSERRWQGDGVQRDGGRETSGSRDTVAERPWQRGRGRETVAERPWQRDRRPLQRDRGSDSGNVA